MHEQSRIWVPGADTFIGAAIVDAFRRHGFEAVCGGQSQPDLADPRDVRAYFRAMRPEYVIVAAGRIAGIGGNQTHPADLMVDNLAVTTNIIRSAHAFGVTKLMYLGSSCGYPKACAQPMAPESLMTGPLESTSEFYATAKLAGVKLCQAYRRQYGAPFITAIPANPFGPADHFDDENSHVIGALIRRMHDAKEAGVPAVAVWGSGAPRRDFIYADDLGDACVFALRAYDGEAPLNIGSGTNTSIAEVAALVRDVVGYQGLLEFDTSRPDGMPLKALDVSRLRALGWQPRIALRDAIQSTYQGFLEKETAWI